MTNFNNRETYLTFRREWKTAYAELSVTIRQTRSAIRQAYQDSDYDRASRLQSTKAYLRSDANQKLAVLKEAKREAQRQYLAEREAEAEKQAA